MKYFITVKLLKTFLMWTVSSSAHSDNLKPTKTPKPVGLFKNLGLTPKTEPPNPTRLPFKNRFLTPD